ncbi:MAG TPA: MFS transporter [Anaerolineales bacterium]
MTSVARPARLRVQLAAFSATRTVVNSGFRMVYPFLPALARGLGVDLQAMALAVTARSVLGVFSPFLGSLADVRGRRWGMVAGLVIFGIGSLIVPLRPIYPVVIGALLISMVGKLIFDPAMQAYLGDRVAYAQRGLAIAVTELGWSFSSLIGIPLIGWLMEARGWSAPFPWLALLAFSSALLLWRLIPQDRPDPRKGSTLYSKFGLVLRNRSALAGLSVGFLTTAGNESVNIMYGAWMEVSFGLQLAALGAATAVIGLSELLGEGMVAGLADRLGKQRIVALAILGNALAGPALLALGTNLTGALIGLFFFYLTFEIVIVGLIPMMTQIVPAARATVLASNVAGLSLGRAVGATAGPILFSYGLLANATAATLVDLLALVALLGFVRIDDEAG